MLKTSFSLGIAMVAWTSLSVTTPAWQPQVPAEAGFTTIRNVGSSGGADVALKAAINDGVVVGPRMWTARHTLSITGGHGDQGGLRHDLAAPPTFENGIVESPEEAFVMKGGVVVKGGAVSPAAGNAR